MSSESKTIEMIEGVGQLVLHTQQAVDDGTIRLSVDDWVQLNWVLSSTRPGLEMEKVTERLLNDIASLMIIAFEQNKSLAKHFGDKLAALNALKIGTEQAGRMIFPPKNKNERLLENRETYLSFLDQIQQKTQTTDQSRQPKAGTNSQ
ncbi:MAG: hypothetical protein ACPGWR_08950 [Ardenticatenaceae bacterium]